MIKTDLLTGKLVRLVAVDPEASSTAWARWRSKSEFGRLLDSMPATLYSTKMTQEWIEKHIEDWLAYEFNIQVIADEKIIGFVGLDGESMSLHGDTFVGIGIGDPDYWGKGYGTEAMQLILRYAFMELNLHRVSLNVFEYNERAIKSYLKAGFQHEGRERQAMLRNGRRYDILFMGILQQEWFARHPNGELA